VGLYFRKSISLGRGFRVNISKSGIGYSYGVKGFRISHGPRGSFFSGGFGGLYFRNKIKDTTNSETIRNKDNNDANYANNFEYDFNLNDEIFTQDEVINTINHRLARIRFLPILCVILLFGAMFLYESKLFIQYMYIIGSLFLLILVYAYDKKRTSIEIDYSIGQADKFFDLNKSFKYLLKSEKIWQKYTERNNHDFKRNSGATSLVTRQVTQLKLESPLFIKTNVSNYHINIKQSDGDIKLYFLPDAILCFNKKKKQYAKLSYDEISLELSYTNFIEEDTVPADAEIVDYIWKYQNKNGTQDRRFTNNYQIPKVKYAEIKLYYKSTLDTIFYLYVSNIVAAEDFYNKFNVFLNIDNNNSKEGSVFSDEIDLTDPYGILNVDRSATADEIKQAYRKLAQIYHPDKFSHLSKDFSDIATNKFQKINDAYKKILSDQ